MAFGHVLPKENTMEDITPFRTWSTWQLSKALGKGIMSLETAIAVVRAKQPSPLFKSGELNGEFAWAELLAPVGHDFGGSNEDVQAFAEASLDCFVALMAQLPPDNKLFELLVNCRLPGPNNTLGLRETEVVCEALVWSMVEHPALGRPALWRFRKVADYASKYAIVDMVDEVLRQTHTSKPPAEEGVEEDEEEPGGEPQPAFILNTNSSDGSDDREAAAPQLQPAPPDRKAMLAEEGRHIRQQNPIKFFLLWCINRVLPLRSRAA